MINKIKNYFKSLKSYDYVRLSLWLIIIILCFIYGWLKWIFLIGLFIAMIFVSFSNSRLRKRARGNGIISGLRGAGKGLILNHLIYKDKTEPYVNVPYHNKEIIKDVKEYLNSIYPLETTDFVNGGFKSVKKIDKFEGRNIYIDDVNIYMPNWEDALLKKLYPSTPPMLAINRHLYNAYMVVTTQDVQRPWKILRELQTDFIIEADKSYGFGYLWRCIPLLNSFAYTKYIYYERTQGVGKLPFKAIGAINEGVKHGYLTSGQATKEIYEAENGKIRYGHLLQLKKHIDYDTRYFHELVYGYKAPKE